MIHSGRLPVASIFRTGRICTPGHSNCYLIIDDYKSYVGCRLRPRLRVRNNKLHSQREICSAGHEPKLLWSLSLWNRNALFAVARVCSRILLLDSCVRRSCILQGENQRFGSQNTVWGKSLGQHVKQWRYLACCWFDTQKSQNQAPWYISVKLILQLYIHRTQYIEFIYRMFCLYFFHLYFL